MQPGNFRQVKILKPVAHFDIGRSVTNLYHSAIGEMTVGDGPVTSCAHRSMAITLSQLARELGVSTMTVSRALRGVGRIGEETRERIVNAARRHGYRPHGLARAMRSGRSGCVALCVADGDVPGTCAMPSQLAIDIDRALTERGMYLAVAR